MSTNAIISIGQAATRKFAGELTLAAQGAGAAGGDITPERRHFAALLLFKLL